MTEYSKDRDILAPRYMSFQVRHILPSETQLAGRCRKAISRNRREENRVSQEAARSSEAELDSEGLSDLRESKVPANIVEVS